MRTRSHQAELLDAPTQDPEELEHSLGQVAQVNRWLGGTRGLRSHLAPHLGTASGPTRILDVGTGNGETLAEILQWASRRRVACTGVGVDLSPQTASLAHARGLQALVGDALTLPFRDGAFHVAMCTLTLHHFDDGAAVALVAEMARVARKAVVVSDLERTRLNHWGARLLAATVWRGNRLTRHDGPLSVLRSFTASELLDIGRAAGLSRPRVRRWFPWRLVLEGEP